MPEIQDDKAQYVVPFILERLSVHQNQNPSSPFIIGLNGVQGAGKTVLVSILRSTLESSPHNLPTVVFSLDDFYLTHSDQVSLAQSHPDNPLLQHRGQPSTHDVPLALSVFQSLKESKPTRIPQYNKAAYSGQGDRVPQSEWVEVNKDVQNPIKVIIFEGWSVGFRPLTSEVLQRKHSTALQEAESSNSTYKGRLGHNTLKSVKQINESLKNYDQITDQFDAFIHIDAEDPQYVYEWRLEQEENLRKGRPDGRGGMTDEEVKHFVDGYYPAYELYTDTLRDGIFKPQTNHNDQAVEGEGGGGQDWKGKQLRLIVGKDRKVKNVVEI